RHAEMEAFLENPTYRAPSKDPAAEAKTHMTKEGHKISEPFRPSLEDRGTPEADLKIEERVRKLEWDSTVEPQFTDILDRATEFYMDVPEELVDNDAIMLLPKLDSQREQLKDADLMQPFMPRDSQPGGIFRASLMHYEKETDRLLQSADRGLTDERDDVRDTANKEREAASMARDYIEVLRRVSKQLLPG
ncbi:MAG: hypothetical protein M3138_05275, partial [Actinomycetota bacterium]|nr:hypothetical protein [Actinomycetota bacterium]